MATRNTTTATKVRAADAAARRRAREAKQAALTQAGLDTQGRPLRSTAGIRQPAQPKPTTLLSWLGARGGRYMGKGPTRRFIRGAWRISSREAAGIRERKRARKEYRDPTIPTHTARVVAGLRARREPTTRCLGCGAAVPPEALATHECGETKFEQSLAVTAAAAARSERKQARREAQLKLKADTAAQAPTEADNVRAHLRAVRAERRGMPPGKRVQDTVARRWAYARGRGAKCEDCHRILREDELADHRCTRPSTPTSNAPTLPSNAGTNERKTEMAINWPGPRGQAAPTPAPASNGAIGTNGSGGFPTEVPTTHDEMKLQLHQSKAYFTALGQQVEELATKLRLEARRVEELQNSMKNFGFDDSCIRPLDGTVADLNAASVQILGASNQVAESGNQFIETYMAIERTYEAALNLYRSGIKTPGETYLSNGQRKGA